MKTLSRKKEAFVKERLKDRTASNTEIAKRAGYSTHSAKQKAYQIAHDELVQQKISRLVDVGLDALERVATNGKNEIAVSQAAKTLVETGLGKPKDNKSTTFGDITINVAKLDHKALDNLRPTITAITSK